MKLKVCGISKSTELEVSINNKVDYCGFILNYPKSHRFISIEQAKDLVSIAKKDCEFVGVLVDPSKKELEIFSKLNLDYFQLYGNYTNQDLINVRKDFGKKIISSIQVKNERDVEKYKNIEEGSDIILWDSSGYEQSKSWDFKWMKSVTTPVEKMIAGNISVKKLKDLVNLADIVDVSGALETNKVKDINKIIEFITEIKKINNAN